ncbi:MAG: Cobalt-precorrin-4 C11-methyltransferase [Oscillospiraceae bacterium]|nr:Cobalt-precorrin-4 C11-methyltransferase [Oscillospiraceae bacterium]
MVYFVGAGSGAVDLITVRGARLLGEADVIIYAGSLVNPQLLDYAKPGCAIHDSAYMTLEQVLAVMRQAEAGGQTTVRLHTGDTSLFSAIREQMDALAEDGIPYQIVPGVSSFCGAAAALGAEYTLPGVSQTVIISRMAGRTPVPEREQIKHLSQFGSTMVLFLSSSLIPQLAEELLSGGVYTGDTPAAIVYKATWPDEQVFHCTIATLEATAKEHHIDKTALITVGGFLGGCYERSKLYDPSFTTGFRAAEHGN